VTGTGFSVSGSTFPVTLSPGQTRTLNLQFAPTAAGSASGQLTITSNSSTNSSAVVALSGSGAASSHEVDLTWTAPAGSSDPVAKYNVYRAPTGTSSFQLVDSTPSSQTTYADSSVTGGQTYDYTVKSADAQGTESTASNTATIVVPQ
jgi:fibronectin type 3 domain-containing protein